LRFRQEITSRKDAQGSKEKRELSAESGSTNFKHLFIPNQKESVHEIETEISGRPLDVRSLDDERRIGSAER
jgi:hypothetical protein